MIDGAAFSIWATDLVLLVLAYWIGRVHAGVVLQRVYVDQLNKMLAEVRALRAKVDHMQSVASLMREHK
jgi:hypothetical protein